GLIASKFVRSLASGAGGLKDHHSLPFSSLGYIAIVGRAKDLIISGGFNVYPAEVEAIIEAVPGVAECAVIGVPHADFGEAVVAVVTAKAGAALEEKTIQAAVAN